MPISKAFGSFLLFLRYLCIDIIDISMDKPKKILVAFAVEGERFPLHLDGAEVVEIVTGVGKTLAATAMALAIVEHQPDLVLNVGTVGTYRHQVGDILVSRHFVDRDMLKLPLDMLKKRIDMSDMSWGWELRSVVGGAQSDHVVTINTGDNFVTQASEDLGCDAVDMEAFAEAWVCRQTARPFLSVKYVTDVLGQNSIAVWEEKLAHARRDLEAYFATNSAKLV